MATVDELEKEAGRLGRILSRNDQYHRYAETADEFFVNLVVEHEALLHTSDSPPEKIYEDTWTAARTKNTGYGEIVSCSNLFAVLLKSLPIKWYYAHTKLFQPFWLHKHVMGKTAGVCES